MQKKIHSLIFIPVAVCAVLAGLSLLPAYQELEQKVYDLFLFLTPIKADNKHTLLLEADPVTLAERGFHNSGTGSLARSALAAGLIVLKEFDARYAVISQEFATESLYQRTPKQFEEDLKNLFFSISQDKGEKDFFKHLDKVFKNEDRYFAQAARFFGNTFIGIKTVASEETDREGNADETINPQYSLDKISLHNMEVIQDSLPAYKGIKPAVVTVLAGCQGAGFINYAPDIDGKIRRVELINKYKNSFIPELGFAALWDWLGRPKVVLLDNQLILKNARLPRQVIQDINIPLLEDNSMLIHWVGSETKAAWQHLSFDEIVASTQLEVRLLFQLKLMQAKGYLHVYRNQAEWLGLYTSAHEHLKDMLASGSLATLPAYRQKRADFFTEVQHFLEEEVEQTVIQKMKEMLAAGTLSPADMALYRTIQGEIPTDFKTARTLYEQLSNLRKTFNEYLPGSFCLIGSSSELAARTTPFSSSKEVSPAFIQANIINTVLTGQFLTCLPWWYALLAAFILTLIITGLAIKLKPRGVVLFYIGLAIFLSAGSIFFFLYTKVFFNPLLPLATGLLTTGVLVIWQIILINREKKVLHCLFFPSLSREAWGELLKVQGNLPLQGERKYLTALSSEMQDFSVLAALLEPQELVSLLNTYLREISDLVMEQKGNVNKFDKSEITALFGAPLPLTDHARRACLAAVRIKKVEKYLGDQLLAKKLITAPLLTRVGISTGEMILGNMGTEKKIDYTAFGPYCDLAMSLKNMNHYYGTRILIGESTYLEGGYDFYVRMLDKVRPAGIKSPLRVYELIDEKHRVDAHLKEGVEIFHEGMHQFEKREWEKAERIFQKVIRIIPKDQAATVLCTRCQNYKKAPPPAHWQNVFNLK